MNVDYEDRGVYTYTATNSIGSDRASANLTVHGECVLCLFSEHYVAMKLFFFFLTIVAPVISDISSFTEVHLGMPAVLACLFTGYPLPSIAWRKDGDIFSSNLRIKIIQFISGQVAVNSSNFLANGKIGNGSIADLLMMHTSFTVDQVLQLGELGVVGLLSFEETVRGDTANYTCSVMNSIPETTTLMLVSENIPLKILGESHTTQAFQFVFFYLYRAS